jgi:hypothetical protein
MSKDTDTGSVREARMAAKKLVRKGETTHQQALDIVAREKGHRNWSAFLRSEAGMPEAARPSQQAGSRSRRRAVDVAETTILEDAASTRRRTPWMPLWMLPPASAFMNVTLYSVAILGGAGLVMGIVAASLVVVATIAGGISRDGQIRARQALRTWVTPVALGTWMIGMALVVAALLRHGLFRGAADGLIDASSPSAMVYGSGLVAYYASTRAHRAMTLTNPESVRPQRLPDREIPASEAILPAKAGIAIRTGAYVGLGLAFLGLGGVTWAIVDMFIQHGLDMDLAEKSFGMIMAGVLVATVFAFGVDLDRPSRAFQVEDESRRAARAKRFLMAGRRVRQS